MFQFFPQLFIRRKTACSSKEIHLCNHLIIFIYRYHKDRDRERPRSREPYASYYGDTAVAPAHEPSYRGSDGRGPVASRYRGPGPIGSQQQSSALPASQAPNQPPAATAPPAIVSSAAQPPGQPPADRKDYYDSYNRYFRHNSTFMIHVSDTCLLAMRFTAACFYYYYYYKLESMIMVEHIFYLLIYVDRFVRMLKRMQRWRMHHRTAEFFSNTLIKLKVY